MIWLEVRSCVNTNPYSASQCLFVNASLTAFCPFATSIKEKRFAYNFSKIVIVTVQSGISTYTGVLRPTVSNIRARRSDHRHLLFFNGLGCCEIVPSKQLKVVIVSIADLILQVQNSNLYPETVLLSSWLSSATPGNCQDSTFNYTMASSFHILYNSSFLNHPH